MKKIIINIKYFIYYIIGLFSFSTIAFITQRIVISILLNTLIDPRQDLYNILNYIIAYYPYYIVTYTLIYFLMFYGVKKYDRYIVTKLNEKLNQLKK